MRTKLIEIQRAIAEIENQHPDDNIITGYKDFLAIREYLHFYKFNPIVFHSLVHLALELWTTDERINRLSLFELIKKYGIKKINNNYPYLILVKTKHELFQLFKNCYEKSEVFSDKQINKARQLCSSILINIDLTIEEEKWLCENAHKSEMILNRLLRYPKQSKIISDWAEQNFENDLYRLRRVELTSWMIDEYPNFKLDKQILIDDFEYFNDLDNKAIETYENEMAAHLLIERDLRDIMKPNHQTHHYGDIIDKPDLLTSPPELKLTPRNYSVPIDLKRPYEELIPDYVTLREKYYNEIDKNLKITMLWAIAYSRHDLPMKSWLLRDYYSADVFWSFFNICKKHKLVKLLKWLIDMKNY